MWDSSLILQGLTSHQRTMSPKKHMFSAGFGGLHDNGFRNAAQTKIPESLNTQASWRRWASKDRCREGVKTASDKVRKSKTNIVY